MKICLMTIFQVPNYGSVLQAYATQKLLEKLGHECEIINYKYPNEWHYQNGLARPSRIKRISTRIYRCFFPYNDVFHSFRKNYLKLTRVFHCLKELQEGDWMNYDIFIVGSDQVWNTKYHHGDRAFLLSFVPKQKRKCSIASSFATNKIPDIHKNTYKKELSKFNSISVREQNGIDIITKQLGIDKNVFLCADPTLLINKDEWLKMATPESPQINKPYILIYALDYAYKKNLAPFLNEVASYFQSKLAGCNVIVLAGFRLGNAQERKRWINAQKSTVPEFISYFAGAKLIITTSFHGTAFALNFGRPLVSIVPEIEDDRQSSLLRNLDLLQCRLEVNGEIQSVQPYYDVEQAQAKLSTIRSECIKWINDEILKK